jgi:hypothetical protein
MPFLPKWLQRRDCLKHALAWQRHRHLRAFAQLRLQVKCAAVQMDQILDDRQPKSGAAFCRLMRK